MNSRTRDNDLPRGIVVFGPQGSGKSRLSLSLCARLGFNSPERICNATEKQIHKTMLYGVRTDTEVVIVQELSLGTTLPAVAQRIDHWLAEGVMVINPKHGPASVRTVPMFILEVCAEHRSQLPTFLDRNWVVLDARAPALPGIDLAALLADQAPSVVVVGVDVAEDRIEVGVPSFDGVTERTGRMAAVFNEWARRYAEAPESFLPILDEQGHPVSDYGLGAAETFRRIEAELFGNDSGAAAR